MIFIIEKICLIKMKNDNEKHGRDFLEFVANNMERLKKNLRKNITYDEDIFDDVFQNTIIKVYNAIEKGLVIKDFEQYFFIASKFEYINQDNARKKRLKNDDRDILSDISSGIIQDIFYSDDDEWKERELKNDKINELFKFLSERLNEVFTPVETDIFLIYYRLKSEKAGISYKKMASITEKSVGEITQIIQKIKKFIRQDEQIINEKNRLLR